MGLDEFPTVNGNYTSWAEIQPLADIPGGPTFKTADFAGVSFKNSLTPGKVRGTGIIIRGRTAGEHDADGQIMMYQDSYYGLLAQLMNAAKAQNASGYGLVSWGLRVDWTPRIGPQLVKSVKLYGVRIIGDEEDHKPSADANVITVPLSIIRIERKDAQGNILRLV